MTKEEQLQMIKERAVQLRNDINVHLNNDLNIRENTYWYAFADGIEALLKDHPILEEIRREDLQSMRDAWEAHGERRMGA